MMGSTSIKIGMYVLSMWLLAFIVVVLSFNLPLEFGKDSEFIGVYKLIHDGWLTILFGLIIVYGAGVYLYLIHHGITGTQNFSIQVNNIEAKQSDPLAFLASYFVPLVSFQLDNIRHELVLVVLFAVIGIMYVKGDLFHLNPTLLLLGFKMYSIEYTTEKNTKSSVVIVSKSVLRKADTIRHIKLSENVWFAFKSN